MVTALDKSLCDAPLLDTSKDNVVSRSLVHRRSAKRGTIKKTLNQISDKRPPSTVEINFYKHHFKTPRSEDVSQTCHFINALRFSYNISLTSTFITKFFLKVNLCQFLCLKHVFALSPVACLCHTPACMTGFSEFTVHGHAY